jgi:murein DD-endopeptidase MepM/ murein hydrolase activator NlpD
MKPIVTLSMLLFLFLSCKHQSPEINDEQSSGAKYVLPFPVGKEYVCMQGFNKPYSHYGSFSYSVDFSMPIGTLITAARKGNVVYVVESNSDNDQTAGHENIVIVFHEDSTYARYVHLTKDGIFVKIGQLVMPGDTIGLSGNSGSGAMPHLHFDVTNTFNGRSDSTIPFDFKNTTEHPIGLVEGVSYKAFPY